MSAPSSFPSTTASPSPTPAAPTDPGTAGSPSGRSRRGAGPGPAVLLVLGSCLSLQFGAVGAAALFPALGSAGTTMLRLGFAAVLMLALVRPRLRGWSAIQWRATIALGLALAGMNGSFYAAIARIPLGAAVAIEFLGPLALAAVLTRRGRDLAWVALALAGIGLLGAESLLTPATLDPVGVALALVAGVFWAGYIITGARVGALMPGAGGLAVALLVATLVVAPFGAVGALRAVGHPDLLPRLRRPAQPGARRRHPGRSAAARPAHRRPAVGCDRPGGGGQRRFELVHEPIEPRTRGHAPTRPEPSDR